MAFVVPCISIVVCYARIFYIVRKTAMRTHESGTSMSHVSLQMHSSSHSSSRETRKELSTNNNKSSLDGTETQLVSLQSRRESDSAAQRSKVSNGNGCSQTDGDNHLGCMIALSHSSSHVELKSSMKFIDTYGDRLEKRPNDLRPLAAGDRNLSSVSISKTVEFIDCNGRGLVVDRDCAVRIEHECDSAVEESNSSSDNNQVGFEAAVELTMDMHFMHCISLCFQIFPMRSDSNCLQILAGHVEPSSSSGIDLPLDTETDSPPR